LKYFKDEYDGGGNKVSLIIGADLFIDLHKFHDIEWILANCEVIVCGRPGNEIWEGYVELKDYEEFSALRINVLENFPQIGISSSFIRDQIKEGKNIWSYVPKSVCKLIDKHALYKRK
jgi:nicotinate-nucleotide adenylyltransferase